MTGDAELLSDTLQSYLIDPHGSGSSTPPADPADYSPEGHARFYEEVRQALALPEVVVLGHSFGATTALTYAALFPASTQACVAVAALRHRARRRRPGRRRGRGRVRRAADQAQPAPLVRGGAAGNGRVDRAHPGRQRPGRDGADDDHGAAVLRGGAGQARSHGAAGQDAPDAEGRPGCREGLGEWPVPVGRPAPAARPDYQPGAGGGGRTRLHLRPGPSRAYRRRHHPRRAGYAGRLRAHPQHRSTAGVPSGGRRFPRQPGPAEPRRRVSGVFTG